MWFVAQLAEHFTVNEAVVGSNPIVPPNSIWDLGFGIADFGLCEGLTPYDPRRAIESGIQNPKSKIDMGPWQKGVCTSLSRKTMTVRVRSAPPHYFRSAILDFRLLFNRSSTIEDRKFPGRLAETDQRRPEEPKSQVRYRERPPIFIKETTTMFAINDRISIAT